MKLEHLNHTHFVLLFITEAHFLAWLGEQDVITEKSQSKHTDDV